MASRSAAHAFADIAQKRVSRRPFANTGSGVLRRAAHEREHEA